MSETGSSNTSSAQHDKEGVQPEPSRQTAICRTSKRWKPRTQTKWPADIVSVEAFDGDRFPTNDDGLKRCKRGTTAKRGGIEVNR